MCCRSTQIVNVYYGLRIKSVRPLISSPPNDRRREIRSPGWRKRRAEFLKQGTLNSLTHSGSYILRDFRLFLIVSIPLKELTADTQTLIRLREDFVSSLNSLQMATRPIPITNFISLLIDLLNPSRDLLFGATTLE